MIGHNNGPSLDDGHAGRVHAWRAARAALLPTLPVEVVRLRVARAAALGLDYRTYAGVRATTGRDIVALLFSSNALGVLRQGERLAAERADRLAAAEADRGVYLQPPLDAIDGPLDWQQPAPPALAPWVVIRDRLAATLRARRLPGDAVLLVAETAAERDWVAAGRLAGAIGGGRYFQVEASD